MAEINQRIILIVLLNIIFSVYVVFLNKQIYTYYGFPNVTLTCLHFVVTTACISVCERLGVFDLKSLPLGEMFRLSPSFCVFVTFTNLSLQANTVGTYQVFKVATTPALVAIETFLYGRRFRTGEVLTLVLVVLGIFLNSYFDVRLTLKGTSFAIVGFLATSLYYMMVNAKQQTLQANSLQLLYYEAPLSATLLMPIIVIAEPLLGHDGLFAIWSYDVMAMVLLSGLLAFAVNFSMFWLIGNLSPLAYNVIGHLKFCLMILGGIVMFNESYSHIRMFATALAFSGSVAFTLITHKTCNLRPPTVIYRRP